MDEGQLYDHRRREQEWVKIGHSHAAVDRVHRKGERQPRIDDAVQIGSMRVEIDARGKRRSLGDRGMSQLLLK
jgi:hypothetical protein